MPQVRLTEDMKRALEAVLNNLFKLPHLIWESKMLNNKEELQPLLEQIAAKIQILQNTFQEDPKIKTINSGYINAITQDLNNLHAYLTKQDDLSPLEKIKKAGGVPTPIVTAVGDKVQTSTRANEEFKGKLNRLLLNIAIDAEPLRKLKEPKLNFLQKFAQTTISLVKKLKKFLGLNPPITRVYKSKDSVHMRAAKENSINQKLAGAAREIRDKKAAQNLNAENDDENLKIKDEKFKSKKSR